MASLYEYFVRDSANNLTAHRELQLSDGNGRGYGKIVGKLHLDFEANAKFVSFYVPEIEGIECPEILALNAISDFIDNTHSTVGVVAGFGKDMQDAQTLNFTGQVYLYSEKQVSENLKGQILAEAKEMNQKIIFRDSDYVEERNKFEKPHAFISHDSRDKREIAEPIALQLQRLMCPVWYDEYSLRVGDGLRESIEKGLKDAKKCVLIITPNFLSNDGWTKSEFNSIFTRELVEEKKLILPVWSSVSRKDVFEYSPILADRFAVNWSEGIEKVTQNLNRAINAKD